VQIRERLQLRADGPEEHGLLKTWERTRIDPNVYVAAKAVHFLNMTTPRSARSEEGCVASVTPKITNTS
jgi:hypothetical protein